MFRSQFDDHDRVYCSSGSPIHIVYQGRYDDDGVFDLFPSGQDNIYDQIQSHRDSVDIHVLLDRYQRGDVDVLSARQGVYGDFTGMPASYSEILNAVLAGERAFMDLPVDERAKYGHSFAQWLSSLDASSPASSNPTPEKEESVNE
nr:unnamed protein product [uncultured bacterium]